MIQGQDLMGQASADLQKLQIPPLWTCVPKVDDGQLTLDLPVQYLQLRIGQDYGAQHVMTPQQPLPCANKPLTIEPATVELEVHKCRHVSERDSTLSANPIGFLDVSHWKREMATLYVSFDTHGCPGRLRIRHRGLPDAQGEIRDISAFHHCSQGHDDSKGFAESRNHCHGKQRVTPQLKEAVM
jgi:hypothetical protein